jgi:uncharacterized protein YbjQ (UPF0145 family)
MVITTLDQVPGREVRDHLGLVNGNTVRSKHVGRDIFAGFKQIVGGEIRGYTEMMEEARAQAVERMSKNAQSMGANAVVGVKFTTAEIMPGAAEVMVYGTALTLK